MIYKNEKLLVVVTALLKPDANKGFIKFEFDILF